MSRFLGQAFSGLRGYKACRKYKMMSLFWRWLAAKWIADLKVLWWCVTRLPYLLWVIAGATLLGLGTVMLALKEVLPTWVMLSDNIRNNQQAITDEFWEARKTQEEK